jgi:hypothetical protein
VTDVKVFNIAISRTFFERYVCKRQILLAGVVYGISDKVKVGVNSSVGYTVTLICGDVILLARHRVISLYSVFLCRLVVRVPGYKSRGLGFDSRRYQIF